MSVGRDTDNDENYCGNDHPAKYYINDVPGISSGCLVDRCAFLDSFFSMGPSLKCKIFVSG